MFPVGLQCRNALGTSPAPARAGRALFGAARSWADSVLKYPDDVVGKRRRVWVLIFITDFIPSLPFKVLGVKLLTESL